MASVYEWEEEKPPQRWRLFMRLCSARCGHGLRPGWAVGPRVRGPGLHGWPCRLRALARRIAVAPAETLTALGEKDAALALWQQVTESHSYPRAKVQLAELYLARNQPDLARAQVTEVLADDAHGPAYQRKRDRVWVRRARSLRRKLS